MPRPDRLTWRSQLGWSPYSPADRADPKRGLVIHYDGSDQRLADKDHEECVRYWARTKVFHTRGRGWADIGYSFGACPHGYVLEGRGLHRYQAAQGTTPGNRDYYSVTLMCGPSDEITDAQVNAVRQLREWLMEPATSIAGTVRGHRDFVSTSCPGDRAYRMVRDGVFTRPAVWGGDVPDLSRPAPTNPTQEDPLIGLKKGDEGEAVKALQRLIQYAGQSVGKHGVDGDYGADTAEALRKVRASVGSEAKPGWGDTVTGAAYAQLLVAVARKQTATTGGGPVEVPEHLVVESLTAKKITVG